MYALRLWATRHARGLERAYRLMERAMIALDPLWSRLGHDRIERPAAAAERAIKGLLFDCRMCGQCVLHETGMACPMNCPKALRNGPCGGVRPDGACEVVPAMRCVWVEAWQGSLRMRDGIGALAELQPAVDHRLAGTSSWLRLVRQQTGRQP